MVTSQVKKIQAFKKLMKLAGEGTFELYTTSKDNYHKISRSWPVEWEEYLGKGHFKDDQVRQNALDKTLERFIEADSPDSVEQMQREREVVRLILDAGADPNYQDSFYGKKVFDAFLMKGKAHIALEIAKTNGFTGPQKPQRCFERLVHGLGFYIQWKHPYPGTPKDTKEIKDLYAQDCLNQRELVYTLFRNGIFPQEKKVFEKLVPIVLEKDTEFFEKRKQQAITQLKQAKTPVQIFNALMGKRKEKN